MKFLIALDGQRHSLEAARFISGLDIGEKDEVRLVHVINFVPLIHDIEDYSGVIFNIKQEIAPRILDEAVELFKDTSAVLSTSVVEGEPVEKILEVARDEEADLIVLGSKGLKGLKRILIGSVARDVVVKSTIPVLLVRESLWDVEGRLRILFATDGSEYAYSASEVLSAVPFPTDSEITLIHVIQSAVHDIPERFYIEVDDAMKVRVAEIRQKEFAHAEEILDRTERILRKRYSDIKTVTKVGEPSTEILSYADKMNPHIIVTGCRGLKGIKGLLGSVSRDVMRYASSSVLIAKRC